MNRYFYRDSEGNQKGPLTIEELKKEQIGRNNLVWTQGMPEWKRAYDVAELQSLFDIAASTSYSQAGEPAAQQEQGYPQAQAQNMRMMPKSWMVESILVTILPFVLCGNVLALIGIAAIVNASKVESLFHQGLFAQAQEASANAARWTKITFWIAIGAIILGIIAIILWLVFFGSIVGLGSMMAI